MLNLELIELMDTHWVEFLQLARNSSFCICRFNLGLNVFKFEPFTFID